MDASVRSGLSWTVAATAVRDWTRLHFGVAEWTLAVFLTAGFFKADPRLAWMPIDLTVLAAALSLAIAAWRCARERGLILPSTLEIAALFALTVPSIMVTKWLPYPTEKVTRFYTLTFLAALAPTFLIRTQDELRRLLNALAVLGAAMAFDVTLTLLTNPGQLLRITAFGSNTIALGRAAGMAFLWVLVLRANRRVSLGLTLLLPILGLVIVASGSRGPLLATAIAALMGYLVLAKARVTRTIHVIVFAMVASGAFVATDAALPRGSLTRVERFLSGRTGESESKRWEALVVSLDRIPSAPLGIGFGGFATKINLWPGEERQFPHDVVVELLLETGWAAGAYFIWLLCRSFYRVNRLRSTDYASLGADGLLCFLIFLTVNELISGELNDSKILFAFVAIALSYERMRAHQSFVPAPLDPGAQYSPAL